MKLSKEQIKRLSDSIQITTLIHHYNIRSISDGGGRFKCFCPFHRERTPSLKVYPETNSWYAYCCNIGGSSWELIKEQEEDYGSAIMVLKQLATIKLPDDPIEEVNLALEETKRNSVKGKIEVLNSLIAIRLRDFLISKRDTERYEELTKQVDQLFYQLDITLDNEEIEEKDVSLLYDKVCDFIRINS